MFFSVKFKILFIEFAWNVSLCTFYSFCCPRIFVSIFKILGSNFPLSDTLAMLSVTTVSNDFKRSKEKKR